MGRVFLSYRREDSQDVTGRIYDRLVEYYSAEKVFKDVDNIPLGSDFRAILDEAVGQAAAVLVIIGPAWVSCTDENGRRRLESPADFVRLEVQAALTKGVPVIPITAGRAKMPDPEELPEAIRELAFRNGLSVRPDPDFGTDMERLANALDQWVSRENNTARTTMNQAIKDLALEREVERIDREWAEEREKYMVEVTKGQTLVDGRMEGGYQVREIPTQAGAIVGGIIATVVGVIFVVGSFSIASFAGIGVIFGIFGLIISVVGVVSSINAFNKASEYELAEAAYRKRRAAALAKGSKAET